MPFPPAGVNGPPASPPAFQAGYDPFAQPSSPLELPTSEPAHAAQPSGTAVATTQPQHSQQLQQPQQPAVQPPTADLPDWEPPAEPDDWEPPAEADWQPPAEHGWRPAVEPTASAAAAQPLLPPPQLQTAPAPALKLSAARGSSPQPPVHPAGVHESPQHLQSAHQQPASPPASQLLPPAGIDFGLLQAAVRSVTMPRFPQPSAAPLPASSFPAPAANEAATGTPALSLPQPQAATVAGRPEAGAADDETPPPPPPLPPPLPDDPATVQKLNRQARWRRLKDEAVRPRADLTAYVLSPEWHVDEQQVVIRWSSHT